VSSAFILSQGSDILISSLLSDCLSVIHFMCTFTSIAELCRSGFLFFFSWVELSQGLNDYWAKIGSVSASSVSFFSDTSVFEQSASEEQCTGAAQKTPNSRRASVSSGGIGPLQLPGLVLPLPGWPQLLLPGGTTGLCSGEALGSQCGPRSLLIPFQVSSPSSGIKSAPVVARVPSSVRAAGTLPHCTSVLR